MYKSLDTLYKWLTGIYIFYFIVTATAIYFAYIHVEMINKVISGINTTISQVFMINTTLNLLNIIQTLLFLCAGILFFIWIYRAYKNLYLFNIEKLSYSPGWAIGWFFVPILSFFYPYHVVMEIWKISKTISSTGQQNDWEKTKASWIITCWWSIYILLCLSIWLKIQMIIVSDSLHKLQSSSYLELSSDIIILIGIVFNILVIRNISKTQRNAYKAYHLNTDSQKQLLSGSQ